MLLLFDASECSFHIARLVQIDSRRKGAHGKWEKDSHRPAETEKLVVEKFRYFPKLYKITRVLEDRLENG